MVEGSAVFSRDQRYRYRLDRWWGDGPRVAWVMLNPSTADDVQDDPTIRRCIGFSRDWGYDGLTVVNLWPFCAASPRDLKAWLRTDPQTPAHLSNLNIRRRVASEAPFVLAAWGAQAGMEGTAALDYMLVHGLDVRHLGLTRDGAPRHPLYVPAITAPERFNG